MLSTLPFNLIFTFHSGKIKTAKLFFNIRYILHLHSTLVRLKHTHLNMCSQYLEYLHSTLVRLKHPHLSAIFFARSHLHSTLVRLKHKWNSLQSNRLLIYIPLW